MLEFRIFGYLSDYNYGDRLILAMRVLYDFFGGKESLKREFGSLKGWIGRGDATDSR